MTRFLLAFAGLAALSVPFAACSSEESKPAPGQPETSSKPKVSDAKLARAAARRQYKALCVSCHGETGRGDGPGSAALEPKPRDFGDPEWQASVTDKHIETIILRGGSAVGKSPAMPPQPQLKSKPEVLKGLIAYIRGLKKKQ